MPIEGNQSTVRKVEDTAEKVDGKCRLTVLSISATFSPFSQYSPKPQPQFQNAIE
jgi:hypothetical protein